MWANLWHIFGAISLPMFTAGTELDMARGAEDGGVITVRDGVVVQV
ncbi:unnamed protein product, partial [Ectocarpus sp. 12 AP-2014]